jgi:hypothetical protein
LNERLREFSESSAGKVTVGVIIVAAAAMVWMSVRSNLGTSNAGKMASDRMFICAKTGKSFWHTLERGESIPVYSSYSKEKTGYPAELCFWNADGSVRKEGFPVLLNQYKGEAGPTFCPDCGRLVIGHNPPADPSHKPPVTKDEYKPRGPRENTNIDR